MQPVIATRLRPPMRAGVAVPRESLPRALSLLEARRLLLVWAPAGYGKSLLMSQVFDALRETRGASVAWLSVGDMSQSLQEIASHLAAALIPQMPHLNESMASLFEAQSNASPETVGALFCNELDKVAKETYLFVDDFHTLAGTNSERLFEFLLKYVTPKIHFAITTRALPTFSIARMRARGELGELDVDELRFTPREAESFILTAGFTPPNLDLIELARQKTEGWPVGMQLLMLSVGNSGDWADRLRMLTGGNRDIGAFLAEDVIGALSEDAQLFLMQSSIFRQFSASLCDFVGERQDSRKFTKELQHQGLFIFSLDKEDQWYRYHHLFGEFLQKRLDETHPTLANQLHRRASEWFKENNMLDDAMYHAFASRDLEYVADVLDGACNDLFYHGRLLSLMEWVEKIPDRILARRPNIQLIRAWNLILEWRFEEASSVLGSVTDCIDKMLEVESLPSKASIRLQRLYLHRKMMLAAFCDEMPAVEKMCLELREDFSDDDPYLRGSIELCMVYAQREQYVIRDVNRLDMLAREYFDRARSEFVLIWHESILGPTLIQRGDVQHAEEGYRSAVSIAHRIVGRPSPLGSMPAVLLAELLFEQGKLDTAIQEWDRYIPLCGELGLVDHLVAAFVGRARLAALLNDEETSRKMLAEAIRFGAAKSFPRLFWNAIAEKIRQAIRRNDIDYATRVASESHLPLSPTTLYPVDGITTKTEAIATAWIRLAIARGHAKEAEVLARRWLSFATNRYCLRTQIRMGILIASAKSVLGDKRGAYRNLRGALELAVPMGFVIPFLEEGDAIKNIVCELLGIVADQLSEVELLKEIVNRLKNGGALLSQLETSQVLPTAMDGMPLVAGLSQREIEILKLMSQGLRNKEIGNRIGITEGTVKWYTQQICDKLGVRRRLTAFQKAKALGLLQ